MKTREEVENLKSNWHNDPCWDIENTEGFEEYKDELKAYSEESIKQWDKQKEEHQKELESIICPLMSAGALADSQCSKPSIHCVTNKCAWWHQGREKCVITQLWHLEDVAEAAHTFNQIHNY